MGRSLGDSWFVLGTCASYRAYIVGFHNLKPECWDARLRVAPSPLADAFVVRRDTILPSGENGSTFRHVGFTTCMLYNYSRRSAISCTSSSELANWQFSGSSIRDRKTSHNESKMNSVAPLLSCPRS